MVAFAHIIKVYAHNATLGVTLTSFFLNEMQLEQCWRIHLWMRRVLLYY